MSQPQLSEKTEMLEFAAALSTASIVDGLLSVPRKNVMWLPGAMPCATSASIAASGSWLVSVEEPSTLT